MQNRSAAYRQMMKSDRRDTTTASIYIGAINQVAQAGCTAKGAFWEYADIISPFDTDEEVENRYFAWEEKWNRIDGARLFVPEDPGEIVHNNGIVTAGICGGEDCPEIIFCFSPGQLDIRGLTIEFGDSYPETFRLETNTGSQEYVMASGSFVTEDVFDKVDYIKIIPGTMSHGATRLRVEKILFGIGILLTGNKIISITVKEKVHPISLELPMIDLSFTIDNQDRYFNASVDTSEINYLEKGQITEGYFYQTLADGKMETIKGVHAVLDNAWKDKGSTAEFSATDKLYQMDGTYERGIYRKTGIAAYDLAVDVFTQAGIEPDEYSIDPYLKTVILHNPLPYDTYANCILLIANACRCVMMQDRNGVISLRASFTPELSTFAENEMEYSQVDRILEKKDVTEYFDWEQAYNRIDGTMLFVPEGEEEYLYAGYVSAAISDEAGDFTVNPAVTLKATAAFTFFQLTLEFGSIYPKALNVICLCDGTETERFTAEVSGQRCIINHAFANVDEIRLQFLQAEPNNRIRLQCILTEESTDFTIERNDMLDEPVIERQGTVKDVIVNRTVYSLPSGQEDVFSDTITVSAESAEFKLEFNDASIPISIITTVPSEDDENPEDIEVNYGAEILEYSNWYCRIRFNNPPAESTEVNLTIQGYVYKVSNPVYTLNVNTTGTTPDALENPLIDSLELAIPFAEWCAEYYESKAEYTVSQFVGDPVLEGNDLVYFENEDGSLSLVRVHTTTLKFDGAYNASSCNGRSVS